MKPRPLFTEKTTLWEDFRLFLIMLAFIVILKLAPRSTKAGFVIATGLLEVMRILNP